MEMNLKSTEARAAKKIIPPKITGHSIADKFRPNVTSGEVEQAVLSRIVNGEFPKGSKLPTCRAFMQQTGVNKNTVSKAFQSLEEQGYVQTVAGKGTFVIYEPFASDAAPATKTFEENINRAIWQANAAGLNRKQVEELINHSLQLHYDRTSVRAILLECNLKEAQQFSRELSEVSDINIDPVLVSDFVANPETYLKRYNVITATFAHLSEVEEALAPYNTSLIAVNTAVIAESLMQIARIPKGRKAGVVCSSEPTIAQLSGFVQAYNSGLEVSSCLESEDVKLAKLIENSDWVIATQTSYGKVHRLVKDKPVIAAEFKIDQQSLVFFSKKVNSIGTQASEPTNFRDKGSSHNLVPR